MTTQLAQMAGDELAQIEGISSIDVEGERIRIEFADGVVASVGRSDLNPSKFAIFFPNPKVGVMIAGSFTPSITGEEVIKRVNELAAKAVKNS